MARSNEVTVDRSGRVCIPKSIRTQLGLSSGSKLVVEAESSKEIRLRPVEAEPVLVRKDGVLVICSSAQGGLEDVQRQERDARLAELTHKVEP